MNGCCAGNRIARAVRRRLRGVVSVMVMSEITKAARVAVPEVNKLLAKELGWGSRRAARELKDANALLDTFTC